MVPIISHTNWARFLKNGPFGNLKTPRAAKTIGGGFSSVTMAGGARPSVKMAKASLDDEVGSDLSMATSGAG